VLDFVRDEVVEGTEQAMVAEWRACSWDHLPPYGVGVAPMAAKGLPTMDRSPLLLPFGHSPLRTNLMSASLIEAAGRDPDDDPHHGDQGYDGRRDVGYGDTEAIPKNSPKNDAIGTSAARQTMGSTVMERSTIEVWRGRSSYVVGSLT